MDEVEMNLAAAQEAIDETREALGAVNPMFRGQVVAVIDPLAAALERVCDAVKAMQAGAV